MPVQLTEFVRRMLAAGGRGGPGSRHWGRSGADAPHADPRRIPPECRNGPWPARRRLLWRRRRGFTLLEIILALAILAGSLAVLGEVVRSATEEGSREETQAQLLAASIMAELVVSGESPANVGETPVDIVADPPWSYTVEVGPTAEEGLLMIRVTVAHANSGSRPGGPRITYSLVRWLRDPASLPIESASDPLTPSASSATSASSAGSAPEDSPPSAPSR